MALEHDERCERTYVNGCGMWTECCCAERALTAARQREEEAKEEIIKLRADVVWIAKDRDDNKSWALDRAAVAIQMADQRDALRAENVRLTLAASESARTLQAEMLEQARNASSETVDTFVVALKSLFFDVVPANTWTQTWPPEVPLQVIADRLLEKDAEIARMKVQQGESSRCGGHHIQCSVGRALAPSPERAMSEHAYKRKVGVYGICATCGLDCEWHIDQLGRHQAEAAKAIRALEYRLRGARFILDGIQHIYPGVGLERSTARLQVIKLIDQTLKDTDAAIQRARKAQNESND